MAVGRSLVRCRHNVKQRARHGLAGVGAAVAISAACWSPFFLPPDTTHRAAEAAPVPVIATASSSSIDTDDADTIIIGGGGGSAVEFSDDYDDAGLPQSILDLGELRARASEVLDLSRSDLDASDYSRSELTGAIFAESSLIGSIFNGSDLRGAVFSRGVLAGAKFVHCDATDALFDYAVLVRSHSLSLHYRVGVALHISHVRRRAAESSLRNCKYFVYVYVCVCVCVYSAGQTCVNRSSSERTSSARTSKRA